jgi:hypothetical protein
MEKREFEKLAMRDGETISADLYAQLELEYMGSAETKEEFVGRVFGSNNTPRTILAKLVRLYQKDNRRALSGNPSVTPAKLRAMDRAILFHYRWMI